MKRSPPDTTPGATPDTASRPDTRARILQAAAQEFVAQGYDHARLAQIARQAGVSRSTLYEHFPGKDRLLVAINRQLIEWMLADMRQDLAPRPNAAGALRRWFRDAISPDPQQRILLRIMHSDAVSSLLLDRAAMQDAARQARNCLQRLLRHGIKSGEFRADLNVSRSAHSLQQLHFLMTRQAVVDDPLIDFGPDRGETTIDLLLRGLLREPARA